MTAVLDNDLFKQCELRRFRRDGRVERDVRWLPAHDAVIGRALPALADDHAAPAWEIVSAPEPALPARAVSLLESARELVRLA